MIRQIVLVSALLASSPCLANVWSEQWTATATDSIAITGDVTLYNNRMVMAGGKSFPIHKLHNLTISAIGGFNGPATLFKISSPSNPTLLNGNKLCGNDPITYVIIWHHPKIMPGSPPGRGLAAFSGAAEPTGSGNPCAVYFYEIGH